MPDETHGFYCASCCRRSASSVGRLIPQSVAYSRLGKPASRASGASSAIRRSAASASARARALCLPSVRARCAARAFVMPPSVTHLTLPARHGTLLYMTTIQVGIPGRVWDDYLDPNCTSMESEIGLTDFHTVKRGKGCTVVYTCAVDQAIELGQYLVDRGWTLLGQDEYGEVHRAAIRAGQKILGHQGRRHPDRAGSGRREAPDV